MTRNLWSSNTPASFWLVEPDLSPAQWQMAIEEAIPMLELAVPPESVDALLEQVLGEGQFGAKRWHLSRAKRVYYALKPFLPRSVIGMLRRIYSRPVESGSQLGWPIEARYAKFLWEVVRQMVKLADMPSLSFRYFWPQGRL